MLLSINNSDNIGCVLHRMIDGRSFRDKFELDTKDNDSEIYTVELDNKYISITSSFIFGLFGDSYIKLGKERFYNKYKFKCKSVFIDKIKNTLSIIDKKRDNNL